MQPDSEVSAQAGSGPEQRPDHADSVDVQLQVAHLADGVLVIDDQGIIRLANAAALGMFGRDRAQLQGLPFGFPLGDLQAVVEVDLRRPDSQEALAVEMRVVPIRWHGSGASLAILRDISDRKRAQDAQSLLAAIVNSSDDAIISKTLDGMITSWNSGAQKLFGYTALEVIGRPMLLLFPPGLEGEEADILARIARGQRVKDFETERLRKDGTRVHVSVSISPIIDADGQIIGASNIARDISGLVLAREHLSRSLTLLRIAGQTARIGGWTIELPMQQLNWSDEICAIHEVPPGFAPTLSQAIDFYPPEYRGEVSMRVSECMKQGTPFDFELQIVSAKGRRLWVRAIGEAVRNASGAVVRVQGAFQDITERVQLEAQLRQSQRLESIGQLTGGLAHDFNNLLTVILGNAELLGEQHPDDARSRMLADMIATAAQRGAELTQRLLAFARRQALDPKAVDVNQLVGSLDGLLRRALGGHIEIELVRAAGLWRALVDPGQLESALLNLAINARDAMPGGGRLTMETANTHLDQDYCDRNAEVRPGQYVLLAVSDSGTGIAPEDIGRVFEPFFTTKETGKGTGLGLAMVYGFVKQSGGHVNIYSEPGHGTTIRLYLPRAQGVSATDVPSRQTVSTTGLETILLVEDDAMVRQFAVGQLSSLGYEVIEAASGREALEVLRTCKGIDLLFTDVVMPGMNGPELAAQAQTLLPTLKVLYTSGYTENAIVHNGRLDPGVQLLGKPYRRAELARKIREVLNGEG